MFYNVIYWKKVLRVNACFLQWSVVSSITFVSVYFVRRDSSLILRSFGSRHVLLRGRNQIPRTRICAEYVDHRSSILVSLGVNLISYLVATQLNSSLLAISVIAVLLPAALHFSVVDNTENSETFDILSVSHGVSLSVPSPSLY